MSNRTSALKRIDVMRGRRAFLLADGSAMVSEMQPSGRVAHYKQGNYAPKSAANPNGSPIVATVLESAGVITTSSYSLNISFSDKQSLKRIVFNGVRWSNTNKNRGKRLFREVDTTGREHGPVLSVNLSRSQTVERDYTTDEHGTRIRVPESGQIAVTVSGGFLEDGTSIASLFITRCGQEDYNNFNAAQLSALEHWGTRPTENYQTPFRVIQITNPCSSNGDLSTYKTPYRPNERWNDKSTV